MLGFICVALKLLHFWKYYKTTNHCRLPETVRKLLLSRTFSKFLKNIHFADLVKDSKSVAGFSPFRQFQVGQNDVTYTRPGCQDSRTASEVASFETNFFRIAGTSEAETSLSRKAGCLLAIGENKTYDIQRSDVLFFPIKERLIAGGHRDCHVII